MSIELAISVGRDIVKLQEDLGKIEGIEVEDILEELCEADEFLTLAKAHIEKAIGRGVLEGLV